MSKKISPKAFAETTKKGQEAGEVGIEGLTIEKPAEVSMASDSKIPQDPSWTLLSIECEIL